MLENLVRTTIRKEDLDINYNGKTAENHFGTEYTVSIEPTKNCQDISKVNYLKRHITLKTPCDEDVDTGHFLAHSLAHELGHTETFIGTNLLWGVIGTVGIVHGLKKHSAKILLYTGITLVSYRLIVEEAIAELAASKFHGAVYMDFKDDISNILNFSRHFIDLL